MSVTAKGRVVYQFLKVTNSRPLVSNWSDSTSLHFNPIEIDGFSPSSMPQKIAYFTWYIRQHKAFYKELRKCGYILLFRTITTYKGVIKWNVDTLLVLEAMQDFYTGRLGQTILVTADGDFDVLVEFLLKNNKLGKLLCPDLKKTSKLLKKITPHEKLLDLKDVLHSITKNS